MAEVKWIKIVTDIFDDEKILLIESLPDKYAIIVCWFKLLCLAGKQNNNGVFMMNQRIAYTDEMLATIFRMPINTVRMSLNTFQDFGMIEMIDGVITIPNWDKHQSLDAYEKKKAYDRQYRMAQREKQKLIASMINDNRTDSRTTVVVPDKNRLEEDIEEDKKEIIEEDKPPRSKRFVPPTVEEVRAYCVERQNGIDPNRFINHYTSNGWMVGRNKMKDWKAAVRTWEQRQIPQAQGKAKNSNPFLDMLEEGDYE